MIGRALDTHLTQMDDRLQNVENFCQDLEIRFGQDIQKNPRFEIEFWEERFRRIDSLLVKLWEAQLPKSGDAQ